MLPFRLEMNGICKAFGGVSALHQVDLNIHPGEVHALVGENGAGKSTLIKILGGAISKDSGNISIDGVPAEINNPNSAHQLGIRIIYQDLVLAQALSAAENIYAGRYPTRFGFLDKKQMVRDAQQILEPFNLQLDLETPLYRLSVAHRQLVEIAKALSQKARILVMDEPSAVLTPTELTHLFEIIRNLKKQGVSIIYISHRLDEIFELADRVTVLRDGQRVDTLDIKELDKPKLIRMMVGRILGLDYPEKRTKIGQVVLEANNLCLGSRLKDISFQLHEGEILGISGLVGAGRTELAHAIFGSTPAGSGTISISNKVTRITNPKIAIRNKLALAPEDRKNQGLVMEMSISSNITITGLKRILKFGFLNNKKERDQSSVISQQLDIRSSSVNQLARQLSGGNQQKVVIGKWLYSNANIFILDEPTQGIDVGAKAQIYSILDNLVRQGAAVLMISSELPEILGMCDRILVMHEGRITGEFQSNEATEEKILTYATGNIPS